MKLSVRMKDHRNTSCCTYLHNALKKYGEDSFIKEIIYTTDDEDDACNKELYYILKYNSLAPNGYNLVLDTTQGRTFHEDTITLMSQNVQGTVRTHKIWSKFIGVRRREDTNCFSARITKRGKSYIRYFSTEVEAAEAYDKMGLYLYGLNARLNFPENLTKYRQINLKKFYTEFCRKHNKTSKHTGVSYVPYITKNKWRSIFYEKGKQVNLGCFKTEEAAHEARIKYIEKSKLSL